MSTEDFSQVRGPGEHQAAPGDTAKAAWPLPVHCWRPAALSREWPGPGCPLSPAHGPAAMLAPPSGRGRCGRAGRRLAWWPPAPLRAAAEPCPSASSAPSHWPPRPAGPAPAITGFTSTFSRALHCGSTTLRRPARAALRACWRGERRPIGQRATLSAVAQRPLACTSVSHAHRPAQYCRMVGWLSCLLALSPPHHGHGPTSIRMRASAAL